MALWMTSIFGEKRPILCVTKKNTKKAIPILVRGLPESVWVGICQNSKLGSPQTSSGFIPIWGPTDTSPPLDKAGKKFLQEVCGVFLFLAQGARSRWRITPPSQRTGVPASESDGGDDEINQTIFGLYVHDGGGDTHIPHDRYGPRHPQQCLVLI
jgi:hypothetical protein